MGLFDSNSRQESSPTSNAPNAPFSPSQAGATRPIALQISGANLGSNNKLVTTTQKNPKSTAIAGIGSASNRGTGVRSSTAGTGTSPGASPGIGANSVFLGGPLETSGSLNSVTAIDASSHDTTYSSNFSTVTSNGAGSASGTSAASAGAPAGGIDWTTIIEIGALILVVIFALRKG